MIYRVGDGDNPAYDYSSQLKPAKNAESQEKRVIPDFVEKLSQRRKQALKNRQHTDEQPAVHVLGFCGSARRPFTFVYSSKG